MDNNLVELVTDKTSPASKIIDHIKKMHRADIAETFDGLEPPHDVLLFRMLPKNIATDVFALMSHETQESVVKALTDSEQNFLINDLWADDAADLIEEMPASVVRRLLNNATPETREAINSLLKYPEDSAGSLMSIDYVRLKSSQTVREALDTIKVHGVNKRVLYTCYVTDDNKTLIGYVSVKHLLVAEPETKIADIMHPNVFSVHTLAEREEVTEAFSKHGYLAIPVTDQEDKLVGVITAEDAFSTIEEIHTEEVHKLAGVRPSDRPYMETGVFQHYRNRIVWLAVLLISATFTGGIISSYETALVSCAALMAFIPMLMDTGGNSGQQVSAQIIRGMALGEITGRQTLRIWWKEVRIAVLCGLTLGALHFCRIMLFNGHDLETIKIAIVVVLSLCCTVTIAKSLGCLMPLAAKRVGLDPAIMVAPIITTLCDAMSLIIYFSIATVILGL